MKKLLKRLILLLVVLAVLLPAGFRGMAALRETLPLSVALPQEGRLVSTSLGRIYVLDIAPAEPNPEAPVLLFAHGTAAWSGLWQPTLQTMAENGYRAIAFDMPPFGYSERAEDGDYSRQKQAARLLALAQALDTKPILVAHSFGAGAAVEAAMLKPEAFSGLVVVNGALGLESHRSAKPLPRVLRGQIIREAAVASTMTNPLAIKRLLASMLYIKSAADDATTSLLKRPMRRAGSTRAYAQWLPSLLASPIDAQSTRPSAYRALKLPVAYIWGEEDTVTPLAQGKSLMKTTPNAQFLVLPKTGHIPQIETPKAFQELLLAALSAM